MATLNAFIVKPGKTLGFSMTLFRVYGALNWKHIEFGLSFYFDKPFEVALLLGPLSVGFVFGGDLG